MTKPETKRYSHETLPFNIENPLPRERAAHVVLGADGRARREQLLRHLQVTVLRSQVQRRASVLPGARAVRARPRPAPRPAPRAPRRPINARPAPTRLCRSASPPRRKRRD